MTRLSGWLPCSLTGAEPRASLCAAVSLVPVQSLRLLPTPFASYWIVMAAQTARLESTRWSWRFTVLADNASLARLTFRLQGWARAWGFCSNEWSTLSLVNALVEIAITVIFNRIWYSPGLKKYSKVREQKVGNTQIQKQHTQFFGVNNKVGVVCKMRKKLQHSSQCLPSILMHIRYCLNDGLVEACIHLQIAPKYTFQ